jgi:hypothetical protein
MHLELPSLRPDVTNSPVILQLCRITRWKHVGRLSKCTRPGNGTEAKGRGGGEVNGLDVEVEVPIATVDDVDASMRREEGGEDWNGSAREQSGEREEERGLVLVWPPNSTTTFIK